MTAKDEEDILKKMKKDYLAGSCAKKDLYRHEKDTCTILNDFIHLLPDDTEYYQSLVKLKQKLWEKVEKDMCIAQKIYHYYSTALTHIFAASSALNSLRKLIVCREGRTHMIMTTSFSNCCLRAFLALEMTYQMHYVLTYGAKKYKLLLERNKNKVPSPKNGYFDKTVIFDPALGNQDEDHSLRNIFRHKIVHREFTYIINRTRKEPIGWFLLDPSIQDNELTILRYKVNLSREQKLPIKDWNIIEVVEWLFPKGNNPLKVDTICEILVAGAVGELVRLAK